MGCAVNKTLIVYCIFNVLIGLAVTFVAIWIIGSSLYLSNIIGTQLFVAACAFLLVGGIMFIATGILGLVAVSKHLNLLTKLFIIFLLVLIVLIATGGVIAVIYTDELESKIKDAMKQSLTDHYGNAGAEGPETTNAWDKLQKDFRCCGVKDQDWKLYRNTTFYRNQTVNKDTARLVRRFVPVTCCVYDENAGKYIDIHSCQTFQLGPPGNPTTAIRNYFLYYEGCFNATKTYLLDHSWVIVGLGFILSVIMLAGVILSVIYIRQLTQDMGKPR